MLILSRRPGESILIEHGIRVTFLRREGDQIKLGITAPDHVAIVREEIAHRPPRTESVAEHLADADSDCAGDPEAGDL